VATERGLNVVDRRFRVGVVGYLYEDFDPVSGRPTLFLSPSPRWSNPLAALASALSVRDPKAFYEAVKSIPPSLRDKINIIYEPFSSDFPHLLPSEMNVLVPFFLEAARSPSERAKHFAISKMCNFKDKRIYEFLLSIEEKDRFAQICLDVHAKHGLIEREGLIPRTQRLVQRMRDCVARLRESFFASPGPWPRADCSRAAQWHPCYRWLVEDAKSLQAMGSNVGIDILNECFYKFPWNPRYSEFYSEVVGHFHSDNRLSPGAMEGLRKIVENLHQDCTFLKYAILYGCWFFRKNWDPTSQYKVEFTAKFAEVVLKAIERARDESVKKECLEALASQLSDDTIREEFIKQIYPRLSETQKRWADQALSKFRGPSRRLSP
jgi:hypothetical protein